MELDGCNHRSESGQCVCDVSSGRLTRDRARLEAAAAASAHWAGSSADADESALLVANDEYSDSCADIRAHHRASSYTDADANPGSRLIHPRR